MDVRKQEILLEISDTTTGYRMIDVLLVVDTEFIKATHPSPSIDPDSPTMVDNEKLYIITSAGYNIFTPPLTLSGTGKDGEATLRDFISFRCSSIHNNSYDAVINYRIDYQEGQNVFDVFTMIPLEYNAAMPNPLMERGLPAIHNTLNFSTYIAQIVKKGEEHMHICFALYEISEKDGNTQELFGYFYCDQKIIVV